LTINYFNEIFKLLSNIPNIQIKGTHFNNNFLHGNFHSQKNGNSLEFNQYNQYTPDEDTKKIDWKVYGRFEKFYLKKYEKESNYKFTFLIDNSNSMNYKAKGLFSKLDYSFILAGALTYILLDNQDSVSHLSYQNGKPYFSGFRNIKSHFFSLIQQFSPQISNVNMLEQLTFIENVKATQKSIVFLFSDFLYDINDLLKKINLLKLSENDFYLVQILDKSEINLDFNELVKFIDMETNEEVITEPDEIKKIYQKELFEHNSKIKEFSFTNKIPYCLCNTSVLLEENLLNIFKG